MINDYITPETLKHLDAISRRKTDNPEMVQELTQETLSEMLETNFKHFGQFLHNYRKINVKLWRREQRQQECLELSESIPARTDSGVDQVISQLSEPEIARMSYNGSTRREIARTLHISQRDLGKARNQIKAELHSLIAM